MPECPFSRERLAHIRWGERWPLTAIAAVASGACSDTITPEIVLAWCEAYGIPAQPPARPQDVLPTGVRTAGQTKRPRPGSAPRRAKMATRPCAFCGAEVKRYASEFTPKSDIAYCNLEHERQHRMQLGAEARETRRAASKDPEIAIALGIVPATKLCHGPCGQVKPITAFSADIKRGDGRARVCLECNKQKCRDYYQRNRATQIARATEYKRNKKAEKTP